MADKLKPGSKTALNRNARWKHNGFFGHVKMATTQMYAIIQSSTTTPQAKELAIEIERLLIKLGDSLKERIDIK